MALAFAPLETSEVISGTIIQTIDGRRTVINVTPSLHVPRLGHRDYYCTTIVAHNRLYGQASYCAVALLWMIYSELTLRSLHTSLLVTYFFTLFFV